jgi:glycosyltransferase involved in cell wall biosynthesis
MDALWDDAKFKISRKSAIADIMRYEILYNEGGFCVDADAVCTRPLEDWLFEAEACASWESETARPGLIAVGYMASVAKNEFFKSIIEEIYNDPDITDAPPWIKTGPKRLTNAYNSLNYTNLNIWPSHYFIPNHYAAPAYSGDGAVFGRQEWMTTHAILKYEQDEREQALAPAKICIYAIALNEIKHVDRFMQHSAGADLVLVCDTGSTDGTAERLRELGATVYNIMQDPWRFDVARNTALSLIPADMDICISIDLDECIQPGWDDLIQSAWQANKGKINKIRYDYTWSWLPNGEPDSKFFASKIHSRQGWQWNHPCHEILGWIGKQPEVVVTLEDIKIHHRPDGSKSRGSYLGLLELGVRENPYNDRNSYYYARELMYNRRYEEAIVEFERHLKLPMATWKEERASGLRNMANCYSKLGKPKEAQAAALRGVLEWDSTRDPWVDLAKMSYELEDWPTTFWAATKALSITSRAGTYRSDAVCWGYYPYDLAALSAYKLGLYPQAIEYGKKAVELSPDDARLQTNLEFYLAKV